MKLLGTWYSPVVARAKIALRLKSVDYDYFEEDLFGSKSELLLKSNPVHNKVPVLIHNNKPILESLNIVEYIDETWNASGPSILPSHPHDRAQARFWSAFVDDKVFLRFFAGQIFTFFFVRVSAGPIFFGCPKKFSFLTIILQKFV